MTRAPLEHSPTKEPPADTFHALSAHGAPVPARLNYPLAYTPGDLARRAAQCLREYATRQTEWQAELSAGKMLGVLVVRDATGRLGYLAAFSGALAGRLTQPGFVPPLLDFDRPGGLFKTEEAAISHLNATIEARQSSPERSRLLAALDAVKAEAATTLAEAKQAALRRRTERTAQRTAHPELSEAYDRESQHDKAELHRLRTRLEQDVANAGDTLARYDDDTRRLREEREHRSQVLQRWLFRSMRVACADGREVSVWDIFQRQATGPRVPPSGTGDCAGPRLLHHAFRHALTPLALAEFWVGASSANRRDGEFYPCCQTKCGPLLRRMLQGLDVDPNPLAAPGGELRVVYEDRHLLVVDKPAGLPTTAANGLDSVMLRLQRSGRHIEGPGYVHRLDQATSGLLVVALNDHTHKELQRQFEQHTVRKRYVALVEGRPDPPSGVVRLPLRPDYDDRPRQMVDPVDGKPCVTLYETVATNGGRSRVLFRPLTGRTHQLRVHAAQGLLCPIVGDNLYGHLGPRLMLHADRLQLTHPATGERVTFEAPADF